MTSHYKRNPGHKPKPKPDPKRNPDLKPKPKPDPKRNPDTLNWNLTLTRSLSGHDQNTPRPTPSQVTIKIHRELPVHAGSDLVLPCTCSNTRTCTCPHRRISMY